MDRLQKICMSLAIIFLFFQSGNAQDSLKVDSTAAESGIKLSAFVDNNKVPLNRTLTLIIRLQWYGNLDRYDVHQFDNPIVENLEIVGTASSNKVVNVNNKATAIQDYEYTLKPKNLGMAYIEGIIIKYTDTVLDQDFRLVTNRISVEVTDPVAEPGEHNPLFLIIGILVLLGVAIIFFVIQKRRKDKAQEEAEPEISLEEKYLEELKNAVNFNDTELDVAEAFSALYKLLRRFVAEKFGVPGLEATTAEVITALREKHLDERFINETDEILKTADVIKFSGSGGSRADLERAFTLIEANLQKSLRGELEPVNDTETEE